MIMLWRGKRLEDLDAMELLQARDVTCANLRNARARHCFEDVDFALGIEGQCRERGWPAIDLAEVIFQ